jgi:lipopolysaccharide biosynthesis glycosyltransferase
MYIVTATDNNYAKYLGVMLHSLLENLGDKTNTNIFIMERNLSIKNKIKLQRIVGRFNLKVEFITINDNDYRYSFPKVRYWPKEAYYRILIPEVLGKDINKVLYLDCDLIIREDISKLWNINIDDYFIAGVDEEAVDEKRKEALSIPAESIYFNSGVLLINLQKWRENNISSKVIQYIEDNLTIIRWPDQDALNAILYDKCLKLEPKWNYSTVIQKRIYIVNPAIVHFIGPNKLQNPKQPFKEEYFKYLKSSRWDHEN